MHALDEFDALQHDQSIAFDELRMRRNALVIRLHEVDCMDHLMNHTHASQQGALTDIHVSSRPTQAEHLVHYSLRSRHGVHPMMHERIDAQDTTGLITVHQK